MSLPLSSSLSSPIFHPFNKPCLTPLSSFIYQCNLISRDHRSARVFGLILFNLLCILIVSSWSISSNSLSLAMFSTLIWFDLLSLLTTLLSFWVEQKKSTKIFTFGHVRCEILAVFVIAIVIQISSLLMLKEGLVRLSQQPDVHTGRLLLGAITCLICHLTVIYLNDKGRAFNHVLSFSSSNVIQEQIAKCSQSLCQLIPGLSVFLLPRVNPLILFSWIGFSLIFLLQLFIDIYNVSQSLDTLFALTIGVILITTMFPMSVYTARILLQTAPTHMIGHLDKCLREATTLDGVLEFRNEHFWVLGFGDIVGSIHVRIRRDANEQVVLAHLTNRLSNLVSDLTIQVFKDEWAWNASPRFLKDHTIGMNMKYTQASPLMVSSSTPANSHTQTFHLTSPSMSITMNHNNSDNNRESNLTRKVKDDWVENV